MSAGETGVIGRAGCDYEDYDRANGFRGWWF